MEYYQEDMFPQQFYGLDEDLKPFAFDILSALYYNSDKGLNIRELYSKIKVKNIVFIRRAIVDMNDLNLIQIIAKDYNKPEKRYFITAYGKNVVEQQYLNKY